MVTQVFRKPRYTEPPRVFACTDAACAEGKLLLWLRNCPTRWAQQVCHGLQSVGIARQISWRRRQDLVLRDGYYTNYIEVELSDIRWMEGMGFLRIAVQSQFRMIQGCEVEWVGINKFLNMKIWHRK